MDRWQHETRIADGAKRPKPRTFHGTKLTDEEAIRKDRNSPTAPRWQHAHFAEIARILRATTTSCSEAYAKHFADELEATNPKFDRRRFLIACGVES